MNKPLIAIAALCLLIAAAVVAIGASVYMDTASVFQSQYRGVMDGE